MSLTGQTRVFNADILSILWTELVALLRGPYHNGVDLLGVSSLGFAVEYDCLGHPHFSHNNRHTLV